MIIDWGLVIRCSESVAKPHAKITFPRLPVSRYAQIREEVIAPNLTRHNIPNGGSFSVDVLMLVKIHDISQPAHFGIERPIIGPVPIAFVNRSVYSELTSSVWKQPCYVFIFVVLVLEAD